MMCLRLSGPHAAASEACCRTGECQHLCNPAADIAAQQCSLQMCSLLLPTIADCWLHKCIILAGTTCR